MTRSGRVVAVAGVACAVCLVVGAPLPWRIGVASLVAGLLARGARVAVAHERVASMLGRLSVPGTVGNVSVRLAPGSEVLAVAGLWRPEIFCDPSTLDQLSEAERRAVVLHESGHVRRRDPVRLLVLSVVSPLLSWSPRGCGWVESWKARVEIAADRHALSAGAERAALASALLRLGGMTQPAQVVGFRTAADLRLEALLGDGPRRWRHARRAALAVGIMVVGICATMLLAEAHIVRDGLACLIGWCWP